MDGRLLEENVRLAGKEASWVRRGLWRQGYRERERCFWPSGTAGEKLTVFPMDPPAPAPGRLKRAARDETGDSKTVGSGS